MSCGKSKKGKASYSDSVSYFVTPNLYRTAAAFQRQTSTPRSKKIKQFFRFGTEPKPKHGLALLRQGAPRMLEFATLSLS